MLKTKFLLVATAICVLTTTILVLGCSSERAQEDRVITFDNPPESQRVRSPYSPSGVVQSTIELDHYMLGVDEDPLLHISYVNISGDVIQLELCIQWAIQEEMHISNAFQSDLRPPVLPGQGEELTYKPRVDKPSSITGYLLMVHFPQRAQLPWAWSDKPRVGPTDVVSIAEEVVPATATEVTKIDLVETLAELKNAMLNKIDSDIDSTAQSFTDVKDYWRSKRGADIFKVPLVIVEGVINTLSKALDFAYIATQADAMLDGASTMCEVISVVMMVQDAREAGEALEYGLHGPTYISAIEKMLEAADATYVPPADKNWQENYKKVIENHLWGTAEGQLLFIPRKTTTVERKNIETITGALEVRTSINRTLNRLISDVENTELPSDFPIDKVVAQLNNLKQEITKSRSWQTGDITYETYLWNGNEFVSQDVEMRLGAVGSLYTFLGSVAQNLDKELEIEMRVEMLKAAGAAGSGVLLWSGNYKIEGLAEQINVTQKAFLLGEIIMEGSRRTFKVGAEEEFYMLPQEMILSLPMELSNLWTIADDTDQYLQHLLGISTYP